jgi:LEA14-like dessication related protein
MKKRISPTLSCLIFILFFVSCKSFKEPEMKSVEKVSLVQMGMTESRLSFDMIFFNPNSFKLKLKKAEGEAWLDGKPLGHFTVDTLIKIPARAEFRMPVQLKLDMRHFLENMALAFTDKQVTLKMEGVARAGKGILFINYPIHYEGKQKLSDLMK